MKLDIQYLFVAKYAKWIIISLIVLSSFFIIYEWASYFFTSYEATPVVSNNTNKVTKQNSFKYVMNTPLFGTYVPNDLNTVKKSMLDVTLVGILFANTLEESQVIIRGAGGEELNYKLGDSIPGEALIKRITAGGVLVERNGALESLSLPKNELTFEPVPKPLKEE